MHASSPSLFSSSMCDMLSHSIAYERTAMKKEIKPIFVDVWLGDEGIEAKIDILLHGSERADMNKEWSN